MDFVNRAQLEIALQAIAARVRSEPLGARGVRAKSQSGGFDARYDHSTRVAMWSR
jgi:hypothetical protein